MQLFMIEVEPILILTSIHSFYALFIRVLEFRINYSLFSSI